MHIRIIQKIIDILRDKKYINFSKSKAYILKRNKIKKQNVFKIIIKNLKYLMENDLEEINNDPNINIGKVTELAAIKTKFMWKKIKVPKIKSDMETIEELVNSKKSIIRMGDGEVNMMLGGSSLFEKANPQITKIFNEIFYKDIPNLLTGTRYDMFRMNTNFLHPKISVYRYKYLLKNYKKMENLYNYNKTYYSACFIYPYIIYEEWNHDRYFDSLRKIWNNKNIVVITGDRVFKKIKYNIFDNAKNIKYIYGPNSGAYEKYNELINLIKQEDKNNILIYALGPCGKLLAYETFKIGYRVLDLGHLIKDYDFYKRRYEMTQKEFCEAFRTHNLPD